jgi:murein DD-endopeptidase MepM/ murein hydrolase activator NlpD
MKVRTLILTGVLLCTPSFAFAQTASEIQAEIDAQNAQIAELNKEIQQYQTQLNNTTKQKNTLQNKVNQLDLQRKKLQASIGVTEKQIRNTQLQIQQLEAGIETKEGSIAVNQAGLGESLRRLAQAESRSLALSVLSSESVTEVWQDVDAHEVLQEAVQDDIRVLSTEKEQLTTTKATTEGKKKELEGQKRTLTTQQGSLDATRRAQAELLAETKSQESNYQSILAKKKAQQASFEAALQDLQAKLQYTINPDQITPAGKGVLRWPLDSVRVTQSFGNTAFAKSGAYNGKGHNGIDLAAQVGTPLKAALSGTVVGTGNTDAVRGCYSFGKWVMIKHSNGLSTMYAHMSQINVSSGQSVATGQLIGYTGETGYATGPHLHFGVYVSSATQIVTLGSVTKSSSACSNAVMPIVPLSGYLNPMSYLP